MTEELCPLCGKNREDHRSLQASGILNHQFNSEGNLVPVDRDPKSRKTAEVREVMVVPGVDIMLRTILVERGILDESDFADAGAYGGLPHSDQRPGAAPVAQGSMRTAPESPQNNS